MTVKVCIYCLQESGSFASCVNPELSKVNNHEYVADERDNGRYTCKYCQKSGKRSDLMGGYNYQLCNASPIGIHEFEPVIDWD